MNIKINDVDGLIIHIIISLNFVRKFAELFENRIFLIIWKNESLQTLWKR